MSDDSFIREVDEQLREDNAKILWNKYGKIVIGLAIAIVLATAAYRGYEYYKNTQAATSGDAYMAALALSGEGKYDDSIKALEELSANGSGQYPALSRIRIASELVGKGDNETALKEFDAIAADTSFAEDFRNLAKLRAGIIAVDTNDYASISARLKPLAAAGLPYRHAAREALGISAMKENKLQEAFDWFTQIAGDNQSTTGVRSRATLMLDILAGKGIGAAS
ncbi:MAG: tetratricopeptide repeat protein [Nitratireductor sp.]